MPVIKKTYLSNDDMKNYRPVSNLNLSKIIKKLMANRNRKKQSIQSVSVSIQKNNSTETATVKIENCIIWNMDEGSVTALILLDLFAAFDILNHSSISCQLGMVSMVSPLSGCVLPIIYNISGR